MSNTQKIDNDKRKLLVDYKNSKKTTKKEGDKRTEENKVCPGDGFLDGFLKGMKLPPIKIPWAMEKLSVSSDELMQLISTKKLEKEGEGISGKSFFDYYKSMCEQKGRAIDGEKGEVGTPIIKADSDLPLLDIVHTQSGYKITHKKEQEFRVNISRDGENYIVNILEVLK